jgi:hypothetical protein
MGKFVKPKDPETLLKQVSRIAKSEFKKATCNKGKITVWSENDVIHIQAENDGVLGADIAHTISKLEGVAKATSREFAGTYDWAADVFIRPISYITIHIG